MTQIVVPEYPAHGTLVRNSNDEWPNDAPVGTFDIAQNRIEGYPEATGHILFVCPNKKRCGVLVGPQAVDRGGRRLYIWAWDGNVDQPTLAPSINCLAVADGKPTSGCGWHGFITHGKFAP